MSERICLAPECVNPIAPEKRADTRFCSEVCRGRDKRERRRTGRRPLPRNTVIYEPKCRVESCGRNARASGLCNRHYENLRRYGDPVPQKDRPLNERIQDVGWTVTPSGCWEWNGKRNDNGYGIFNALRQGVEGERAHRVVYQHLTGDQLPSDKLLRHKCDNPPCVNPDHLIPGTHQDNSDDMVNRRRHYWHRQTTCREGHDLTRPGATKEYVDGARCVECRRIRTQRYEARREGA